MTDTAKASVKECYPDAICIQSDGGNWFVYRSDTPSGVNFSEPIACEATAKRAWKSASAWVKENWK